MIQFNNKYHHNYKGKKIEFNKVQSLKINLRKGLNFEPNFFINDGVIKKDLLYYNRELFFVKKNLTEYLEKNYTNKITSIADVSIFEYKGRYYYDKNSDDKYEYILVFNDDLKDSKIETVFELIKKTTTNTLIEDNFKKTYLISCDQDYNNALELIPENYRDFIICEKNFRTLANYNPNSIDPEHMVFENETVPYCEVLNHINTYEAHKYFAENFKKTYTPKIAVFDNGICNLHPELFNVVNPKESSCIIDKKNTFLPAYEDTHGTACAGIIGATKTNDNGFNGIGTGCELIAYKIASGNGTKSSLSLSNFTIIKAFYFALKTHCDVISCSWELSYESQILRDQIIYTINNGRDKLGIPIVFSAGNSGEAIEFPKNIEGVITVAATNLTNQPYQDIFWQSNYGENVFIAAPGNNTVTTDFPGPSGDNMHYDSNNSHYNNYTYLNGTSASAPMVSGLISLILQIDKTVDLDTIKKYILAGASPINIINNNNYGGGVINILNTLKYINNQNQ